MYNKSKVEIQHEANATMKNTKNKALQQISNKALTASVALLEVEHKKRLTDKVMLGAKVAGGSGFFVGPGLIATNIHCVVGTTWVFVESARMKTQFPIESVVAFDDKNDLVILKVAGEATPLPLGDSDALKINSPVYAVRCVGEDIEAKGAKGVITPGTVHGIGRSHKHLRLRAPLSHGNSGGPVLNKRGEVIGIVTAGGSPVGKQTARTRADFAYAIPSNALKALLEEVRDVEPFEAWREQPRIRAYAELAQANKKQTQGQYRAAIKHYDAALQLNPDLTEAYHNRGALRNVFGQHKKAIADWNAALKRDPELTEAYYNRGAAKHLLGDYKGCITDCSAALQRNPDAVPAYYNRAQARMELNQYAEGIEDFDKAISLHLSRENLYGAYYNRALGKYLLGQAKAAQGDEAEAVRLYHAAIPDYTQAIKVAPDADLSSRNYNNRGYAKYLIAEYESAEGNMGKARKLYEAAISDSEEAIKLNRNNAYAYCTRAVAKVAFDAHEAAIDDFDIAIKLKSDFAHAYYQRGLAKQEIGRQQEAEADFRTAKRLDPDVGK